jgi:hypothetical protein
MKLFRDCLRKKLKENGNLPLAIWAPVSTFFATVVAQKHKLSEF